MNFIAAVLALARQQPSSNLFRLTVATWNHRAIHLYEKEGFQRGAVFIDHVDGTCNEWLIMICVDD